MDQRNRIIDELGSRMAQAARASVAGGAVYDPGEQISTDAAPLWRGIAESLVAMMEIQVRDAVAEIRKAIDAQS